MKLHYSDPDKEHKYVRIPSTPHTLPDNIHHRPNASFDDAMQGDLDKRNKALHRNMAEYEGLRMDTIEDIKELQSVIERQNRKDWEFLRGLRAVHIENHGNDYVAFVIPQRQLRDPEDRREVFDRLAGLANNPSVIAYMKDKYGFNVGFSNFVITNAFEDSITVEEQAKDPIGLTYETIGFDDHNFTPVFLGAATNNAIQPEFLAQDGSNGEKLTSLIGNLRLTYIEGNPIYLIDTNDVMRENCGDHYPGLTERLATEHTIREFSCDAPYSETMEEYHDEVCPPVQEGTSLKVYMGDRVAPLVAQEAQYYYAQAATNPDQREQVEFVDCREDTLDDSQSTAVKNRCRSHLEISTAGVFNVRGKKSNETTRS